jgi:OFA family oxalate/formate antiporter-like MFS transporter
MIGTALLRNPPPGYRPPNWQPTAAAASARDVATAEMVTLPTFYCLWVGFCLGTTAGLMTISQLVPFARNAGMTATVATFAITVGAFGNAGGRILSGWISDSLGRVRTLQTMILISAVAMPILFFVRHQIAPFYTLVAIVYWCYGTQLSVVASTMADFYGTKNLGMNYGVLFTAWGAAGILGPAIAARVFDRFGDYRYAFFSAGALALVAYASLTLARAPVPSEQRIRS